MIALTKLDCRLNGQTTSFLTEEKNLRILTKYTVSGGSGYAVIGAGLNINQDIEDFAPELREKAGSLYLETGVKRDCRRIAEAMARAIYEAYLELDEKREEYMEEYRSSCMTLGRRVEFTLGGKTLRGRAQSIGRDGSLGILLDNGEMFSLRFGEASVI